MEPMEVQGQDGMNLDPAILSQVQMNFLAQARVREVQMEAAIAQLRQQAQQREQVIADLTDKLAAFEDDRAEQEG